MKGYVRTATAAAILACLTLTGPVMARSDAADAAMDRAKAEHKAAKERCEPLKGNDQDVCEKQADANYTKAKADIDARDKGTTAARGNAAEDKAEAQYELAKEKCDALKGQQEDACNAQAKADYERAKAQAPK